MEDFLVKTYAIVHWEEFHFDHVYPTRSSCVDASLFSKREQLILQSLAPTRWRKLIANKKVENKENVHTQASYLVEYQPFNIAEMEVEVLGSGTTLDAKTDELTKLYQSMGLIMN
jgi:hypothetical protein